MRLLHFGLTALCALVLGGYLRAADPPTPSNPGSATGTVSLDDLRRALETAPPGSPSGGNAGDFDLSVPPIQLAPDAAASAAARNRAGSGPGSATSTKSSNHWLLDAMRQPNASGRPADNHDPFGMLGADNSPDGDPRSGASGQVHAGDEPTGSADDTGPKQATSATAAAPAKLPDPFAGYLRNWLSPGYAALLPTDASGAGFVNSSGGVTAAASEPVGNFAGTGDSSFPSGGTEGAVPGSSVQAPNPYLEILAPPMDLIAPGGASLFDQPQYLVPLVPPPTPEPVHPAPPPSSPANFVPPPLEDKQLPQLKRF